MGIRKVPAVLFDSPQLGQAVVYGVTGCATGNNTLGTMDISKGEK